MGGNHGHCVRGHSLGGGKGPEVSSYGGLLEQPGDLSNERVYSSRAMAFFESGSRVAEYAFYAWVILGVATLIEKNSYPVSQSA